ncbi:MAG: efflux RND transporter permease subunit, partial [Planctomycetota bacterium]
MTDNTEILPENIRKGPVTWMARHGVAANLVMLVLIAGGILTGLGIKQEVFPEFDLDQVRVSVSYPGASPEEVEQGIVLAIEEAVRSLDGIDEINSSAREGSASVNVEFITGTDPQKLHQDIKQEVDRIRTFPEDAEDPQVTLATRRREVLQVALYGDVNEKILAEYAEELRDRIMRDAGITQIDISGVRDYEISIEVPEENLRAYNLTLAMVADAVNKATVEIPGGSLKTKGGEILLRVKEKRDYGREFAEVPVISSASGTQVKLGEIATIIDGFEDTDRNATYNGKRAVLLEVFRTGNQTPIQVSDDVRRILAEIKEEIPPGLFTAVPRDRSNIYRQRMELLLRNAYIGLALVLCLLAFFLELRLAFWVMMGIPISFLGGFIILPLIGVSINMISMFAFIIALGIVVDDAIVVGENIHEHLTKGDDPLYSVISGAKEVAVPVTFSILTNVVTFLPLAFVPGVHGKIFKVIPYVVISVFLISLFESLFILPAHLRKKVKRGSMENWIHYKQQNFSTFFISVVNRYYGPMVTWALRNRYISISIAVAIMIITAGYVGSGRMGREVMPRVESDYAVVSVALPFGSPVAATEQVRDQLIASAERVMEENGGDKLVKGIYADLGRSVNGTGGGHTLEVRVFLTGAEERPISTKKFTEIWREFTGPMANVEFLRFENDRGGPGGGASLSVELSHKDIKVLEEAGEELSVNLMEFPNVKDIDDGFQRGKVQYDYKLLPEGRSLGLTSQYVARQIRNNFYGAEVLRQQRGRNEIKVMVRKPESERISEQNLEDLLIKTPAGKDVPLRHVAEHKKGRSYTSITRRNSRRTITVTADVSPRSKSNLVLGKIKEDALPDLIGFIVAVFVIYALLSIPFQSYSQPLIVMVSIPFGIVGAVIGHLLMDYSLSIMSMMGVVALSGVVVNDSLVLIDYANKLRASGDSAFDAVRNAGIRRFRPILLTTLTTFGGLAPMIFETSRQARFMIPMALSLGFGILFATVISLILVPCLFLIIDDIKHHV